jgi:hypothetical protein
MEFPVGRSSPFDEPTLSSGGGTPTISDLSSIPLRTYRDSPLGRTNLSAATTRGGDESSTRGEAIPSIRADHDLTTPHDLLKGLIAGFPFPMHPPDEVCRSWEVANNCSAAFFRYAAATTFPSLYEFADNDATELNTSILTTTRHTPGESLDATKSRLDISSRNTLTKSRFIKRLTAWVSWCRQWAISDAHINLVAATANTNNPACNIRAIRIWYPVHMALMIGAGALKAFVITPASKHHAFRLSDRMAESVKAYMADAFNYDGLPCFQEQMQGIPPLAAAVVTAPDAEVEEEQEATASEEEIHTDGGEDTDADAGLFD